MIVMIARWVSDDADHHHDHDNWGLARPELRRVRQSLTQSSNIVLTKAKMNCTVTQ